MFRLLYSSGKDFVKKFDRLKMHLNPLSLLNDDKGLRVLIYSRKSVQEQFMNNLHAVLKQSTFELCAK